MNGRFRFARHAEKDLQSKTATTVWRDVDRRSGLEPWKVEPHASRRWLGSALKRNGLPKLEKSLLATARIVTGQLDGDLAPK